MNYWLLKTEPGTFSWADMTRDRKAVWDGVRNFQARKHLKEMKKGDLALIYHTGSEKAIVGQASLTKEFYLEPGDPEWIAVDLLPGKSLKNPVTLARVKQDVVLLKMVLVKSARLSVQPVTREEYERILELSLKP